MWRQGGHPFGPSRLIVKAVWHKARDDDGQPLSARDEGTHVKGYNRTCGKGVEGNRKYKKKESVASLSCLAVGANRGKKQRIANEACLNCGCGDLDLFRLIIDMPNEARGSE